MLTTAKQQQQTAMSSRTNVATEPSVDAPSAEMRRLWPAERSEVQQQAFTPRLTSTSQAPIQRWAYVGDRQIMENYDGIEKQPEQIGFDGPTPEEDDAMSDRYYRHYNGIPEFRRHMRGDPVDVGLVKSKALWYRLPFSAGFFVLGENHSVLNYRTIIEESHQDGHVLGEGGTVPIDHYSADTATRFGAEGTRDVGDAVEHFMESVFAKTEYAIGSIMEEYDTPSTPYERPRGSRTLPAEDWYLAKEEGDGKVVSRDRKKDPYFKDGDDRVYLDSGEAVGERGYSRYRTALRIANETIEAIDDYKATHAGALNYNVVELDQLKGHLEVIVEHYSNLQYKTPKQKRTVYKVNLRLAYKLLDKLAREEVNRSTIIRGGLAGDALIANQAAHEVQSRLGKACTLRDIFMYEAIIDANVRGFKMAGIGNNHLHHLRPALPPAIRTISYHEFINPANGYSQSATEAP